MIPVRDALPSITQTLDALVAALDSFDLELGYEILIVDDGSQTRLASWLDLSEYSHCSILEKPHTGRFHTRYLGLEKSRGRFILFLDSRVHPHRTALHFVFRNGNPSVYSWNAHVDFPERTALVSLLQRALEKVAWSKYWRQPRPISYTESDFGTFPFGTTMLLASSQRLHEAFAAVTASQGMASPNDDAHLLRELSRLGPVAMDPRFSCTYFPRTGIRKVWKHWQARGGVLIDGHSQQRGRLFFGAMVLPFALALLAALLIASPAVAIALVLCGAIALWIFARWCGCSPREAMALVLFGFPFSVAYTTGILGSLHRIRKV